MVDINAFACDDGSVRVFSYNTDVKDAMKNAYTTSGLLGAASTAGGAVGKLSDSQWGGLVSSLMDSRFSKKQEYAADDFSLQFCVDNKINPYAMALSLEKLVQLFGSDDSSKVAKMFFSHPDSEKRAVRARQLVDKLPK